MWLGICPEQGVDSDLWEGFALSGSLPTSYVYTGWLIFIIAPCEGTENKGCQWSPWDGHHGHSSLDWDGFLAFLCRLGPSKKELLSKESSALQFSVKMSGSDCQLMPVSVPGRILLTLLPLPRGTVIWLVIDDVMALFTFCWQARSEQDLLVHVAWGTRDLLEQSCPYLLWGHDVATQCNPWLGAFHYWQLSKGSVCFLFFSWILFLFGPHG